MKSTREDTLGVCPNLQVESLRNRDIHDMGREGLDLGTNSIPGPCMRRDRFFQKHFEGNLGFSLVPWSHSVGTLVISGLAGPVERDCRKDADCQR